MEVQGSSVLRSAQFIGRKVNGWTHQNHFVDSLGVSRRIPGGDKGTHRVADEGEGRSQLERVDGSRHGRDVLFKRVFGIRRNGRLPEAEQVDGDAAVRPLAEWEDVLERHRRRCDPVDQHDGRSLPAIAGNVKQRLACVIYRESHRLPPLG